MPAGDGVPHPALASLALEAESRQTAARAELLLVPAVLASIPSPSTGTLDLGPLTIHMYGLMLLLAIVACILLTGLRWTRRGGDWDLVLRVAVWGVAAGVVGARLYHDITSWSEVPDPKWRGIFAVWEGGLGVWGGILLGCLVGAIVVHRAGESVLAFMDAVAPGLLLAQGIGRIGNWWNQELFGKPTDLPWALEDRSRAPAARPDRRAPPTTRRSCTSSCGIWPASACCCCSTPLPVPPARAVRALRLVLLLRPLLRGAAADRPGPRARAAAPERLGLRRRLLVSTAFFIWWQFLRPRRRSREARTDAPAAHRERAEDGDPARAASGSAARVRPCRAVRELDLDLDAFEGPFDLLLTLVLREEIALRDVDLAAVVHRVRRAPRGARRARPRRVRRVPRPDLGAPRAEGARPLPGGGRRAGRARAGGRGGGARAPPRGVPQREGGRRVAPRAAGRACDFYFRTGPAPLAPARPEPQLASAERGAARVGAARARRRAADAVDRRTWRCASRPSRSSSTAGARCCDDAIRFDFDREVAGLSRIEVAVAFLAVLELRKQDEIAIAQAAPFAPMRISRADAERSLSWTVRSA